MSGSWGRILIIGDVHGCLDELESLIALLLPRSGDRLYFLGDLVDRGPYSVAVVRRVRDLLAAFPGSIAIAGNHEEKALRHRDKGRPPPDWAGAMADGDWEFLEGLPLMAALPEIGAVLVHGGFYPKFFERHGQVGQVPAGWRTARDKQADRMRRFLRVRHVSPEGEMVALGEESAVTRHWSQVYDGCEGFAFFGHDPQLAPPQPLRGPFALGLDTGCCFGGRLSAAIVPPGGNPAEAEIVSVPGRRYAEPRLARVEG
ncbi:MAG: metallophosphoesterase [Candidatus Sericytochromatia bacterium]|nr:metallophosphoesterase [Candidatus Tanganyikabacteria bacterium]